MNNVMLEQSFVVTFKVNNLMCNECNKQYTNMMWEALVQIRQKVEYMMCMY